MTESRPRSHGTQSSYVGGCRCQECRTASAEHRKRHRAEKAAARQLVDGRMVAVAAPVHGSSSTYHNHFCRCAPCTEAASRDNRFSRRKATR